MLDKLMRGFLFLVSIALGAMLVMMWIDFGWPVSIKDWLACIVINILTLISIAIPAGIALDKELWN